MSQITPSQENCASCQTTDGTTNDVTQNQGVTYNEGTGVKDRVIISGPLSEVLAKQLSVVFKKKDLSLEPDVPDADIAAEQPATETYAQDQAIAQAFYDAANEPDNQVILGNFDVASIKEHVERKQNNRVQPGDIENVTDIPVLVVTEADLLDTANIMDVQLKSTDELLVVMEPDMRSTSGKQTNNLMHRQTGNAVTQTLRRPEFTDTPKLDGHNCTLSEKIEALERMYGGQVKRIHFGVEAFIASLGSRVRA